MASYYPNERDFENFLKYCGRKVNKLDDGRVIIESIYTDYLGRKFYIEAKHSGEGSAFFHSSVEVKGLGVSDAEVLRIVNSITIWGLVVEGIKDGRVYYRMQCMYKKQLLNYLNELEKVLVWCNLMNIVDIHSI